MCISPIRYAGVVDQAWRPHSYRHSRRRRVEELEGIIKLLTGPKRLA
jgi:hypothetical protein